MGSNRRPGRLLKNLRMGGRRLFDNLCVWCVRRVLCGVCCVCGVVYVSVCPGVVCPGVVCPGVVCPVGVVWCGVVWCGVVWCGVVWCGVVWCGVVWCGVVWCGVVWCGVVWCAGVFGRQKSPLLRKIVPSLGNNGYGAKHN